MSDLASTNVDGRCRLLRYLHVLNASKGLLLVWRGTHAVWLGV